MVLFRTVSPLSFCSFCCAAVTVCPAAVLLCCCCAVCAVVIIGWNCWRMCLFERGSDLFACCLLFCFLFRFSFPLSVCADLLQIKKAMARIHLSIIKHFCCAVLLR
jgi:hypothetical protein